MKTTLSALSGLLMLAAVGLLIAGLTNVVTVSLLVTLPLLAITSFGYIVSRRYGHRAAFQTAIAAHAQIDSDRADQFKGSDGRYGWSSIAFDSPSTVA